MAKVQAIISTDQGPDYQFYCPGCKSHHGVWVKERGENSAQWSYNEDPDKPTFSPSILVRWTRTTDGTTDFVCHSFVTNGMIKYLDDCTHELKGQTVELPNID